MIGRCLSVQPGRRPTLRVRLPVMIGCGRRSHHHHQRWNVSRWTRFIDRLLQQLTWTRSRGCGISANDIG